MIPLDCIICWGSGNTFGKLATFRRAALFTFSPIDLQLWAFRVPHSEDAIIHLVQQLSTQHIHAHRHNRKIIWFILSYTRFILYTQPSYEE